MIDVVNCVDGKRNRVTHRYKVCGIWAALCIPDFGGEIYPAPSPSSPRNNGGGGWGQVSILFALGTK